MAGVLREQFVLKDPELDQLPQTRRSLLILRGQSFRIRRQNLAMRLYRTTRLRSDDYADEHLELSQAFPGFAGRDPQ